jgi:hypothetical protein
VNAPPGGLVVGLWGPTGDGVKQTEVMGVRNRAVREGVGGWVKNRKPSCLCSVSVNEVRGGLVVGWWGPTGCG